MDRIRTLLLARTQLVVLDRDSVASAATRPTRSSEVDKFEAELVELGFVMSLDLAQTMRRLPHQAIAELRNWMLDTLATTLGAHRPHVPLFRQFPAGTPEDTWSLYTRRVLSWLFTRPEQPCPWCGEVKAIGAINPCGHLVCRTCWDGGSYAGCPICHHRVALNEPFIKPPTTSTPSPEPVLRHAGELRLLHLGFDLVGSARARFERLIARASPLSPVDRSEVETVIDELGPRAATWLPSRIAVKETMAIAIARLWMVAPDRRAMVRATQDHLRTATDVLRVAVVLMGADPGLTRPCKLASIPRSLRVAVLEALDRLPPEALVEDVRRHEGLWKRVGERLHPFEHAKRLPTAALAFAVVRGTSLAKASFGPTLRAQAEQLATLRIAGPHDRVRVVAWLGEVEDGLRQGNARAVADRLAQRPGELLRRADHLVRVCQAQQPDALAHVLATIQRATKRGAPGTLLTLAAHVARRGALWPRRVFFPKGEVLRAWGMRDCRPPLRSDAIGAVVGAVRAELVARAAERRNYPRAVLDRGLGDLLVPLGERSATPAKIAWPRGSEIPLVEGERLRLFLHWEEPAGRRVDLDLSVAFYDAEWRHVATCDFTNLRFERAAVHSGDLTNAPAPLGASEFVDLDLIRLHELGARHAVMVVFSYNGVHFDRLVHGFAGLMVSPVEGAPFDPRSVAQRFDLRGKSVITVPLTIDLDARRLRWLDVHVTSHADLHQVGGYRVALAHLGRDFAVLSRTAARPTLWELACIHAAGRANIVYVRERDGTITTYRRRDGEPTAARLWRLLSGSSDDGQLAAIPPANAPTWFALLRDDLAIPAGSAGYILDARVSGEGFTRLAAGDLLAELAAKP